MIQPIFWSSEVDPAALLLNGGNESAGPPTLNVAELRDRAVIALEPPLIRLAVGDGRLDVSLSDPTEDRPLGAFIMFDDLTPDRLTAVERLWRAVAGKRVPPDPRMTPQRRDRARLMLRAVDARNGGAIYRTIAEHLFPKHKIDAASWVGDPIREATIRLARDGLKLVRGGYRALLRRPRRER